MIISSVAKHTDSKERFKKRIKLRVCYGCNSDYWINLLHNIFKAYVRRIGRCKGSSQGQSNLGLRVLFACGIRKEGDKI